MGLRLGRRLLLLLLLRGLKRLLLRLLLLLRLALARVGIMDPWRTARGAAGVAGPVFAATALAAVPMRPLLDCWVDGTARHVPALLRLGARTG